MIGMTPIPSASCLPPKRTVKPSVTIRPKVLDGEIPKLNMHQMGPTIRKALQERAQFYRRKLCFYETMQKLDQSFQSEEMNRKI